MCLSISSFRRLIARPAVWSIGYSCVAIALLTLNPYHFQAYSSSEWWVLRFQLSDICQNIVLFLSLGILLRHRLRCSYRRCLFSGFWLSLLIETAQLFLVNRTSNCVDLFANSAGALFGALAYGFGFKGWDRETPNLDLALMLIPICWARSLLALIMPSWIGLLGLYAIAAFALLSSGSSQPRRSLTAMVLWSLVAFAPMARYRWKEGVAIALMAGAVQWLSCCLNADLRRRCLTALGLSFVFSLAFSSLWLLTDGFISVPFWPNLPAIESLLLGALLLAAKPNLRRGGTVWSKQSPYSPDDLT